MLPARMTIGAALTKLEVILRLSVVTCDLILAAAEYSCTADIWLGSYQLNQGGFFYFILNSFVLRTSENVHSVPKKGPTL